MGRVEHPAQGVDYYPDDNLVLLIRCPECGRENYALSVTLGICCWCGFNARELLTHSSAHIPNTDSLLNGDFTTETTE